MSPNDYFPPPGFTRLCSAKQNSRPASSWLNAVENFFSALTRRRLRRGVFHSIVDLQAAINRYLDEHNRNPKPFVWTKPARDILAKLNRLPAPSV